MSVICMTSLRYVGCMQDGQMYTRIIQPIMDWDALSFSRPVLSQHSANLAYDPLTCIKVTDIVDHEC